MNEKSEARLHWEEAQGHEKSFWGDCSNTYGEETKQLVYAREMSIKFSHDGRSPWSIDLEGRTIMDIGGGPVSMLLKCRNGREGRGAGVVIDPCEYPAWVDARYNEAGITRFRAAGEDLVHHTFDRFDEVWIYNVLQHTFDPAAIIENAKRLAPVLRIFEWIDIPAHDGHPQELTEINLLKWIARAGVHRTGDLHGDGTCFGRFFSGVFNE